MNNPVRINLHAAGPGADVQTNWTGQGTVDAPPEPVRSHLFGTTGPELTFWMPTGGGRLAPMAEAQQTAAFRVLADLAKTYVPATKHNKIDEIAFHRDKIVFYVKLEGKKGREVFEAAIEQGFNPAGVPHSDLRSSAGENSDFFHNLNWEPHRAHYPNVFRSTPVPPAAWPRDGFPLDLRPRAEYESWHGQPSRQAPQVSRSVPEFLTMLMLQHKVNGHRLADLVDRSGSLLHKPRGHLYESWLQHVDPPRVAPREPT